MNPTSGPTGRAVSRLSPEWQVLLSGARIPPDEAGLRRTDVSAGSLDWPRIAEIATQHRVAPLLYSSLRRLSPPRDSKAAMQILRRAYLATGARNAVLYQALGGILEALTTAGVPVIVLKGAFLADTVYPERALRPMNDIDLMIREEDLDRAEAQLRRVGYELAHDPTTKEELRTRHHHWVFRNAKPVLSGIPLELHWRLDPPGWPFRVNVESLWKRAIPTRIAGVKALGLAPEDLLLHLSTHACRHRFNGGLLPLCDIAAATTHYGARIDWARLEARAAEWCDAAYASIPLQLSAELVGAAVPASTLAGLRGADGGGPTLQMARERILEEKGPLRAAAELRLRWRRSSSEERSAALGRALLPEATTRGPSVERGSTKPLSDYLVHLNESLRRYVPLAWSLVRHPRAVASIVRREAGKSELDSWCSPSNGSGAGSQVGPALPKRESAPG